MARIVRHHAVAGNLATNLYLALGPWPAASLLRTLIVDLNSNQRQRLLIAPVLHPASAANAATLRAGTPVLDASHVRLNNVNAYAIVPNTATSTPHTLPLELEILTPGSYLHVHVYDPGPISGAKTISLHLTGDVVAVITTTTAPVWTGEAKIPPVVPPMPQPPPVIPPVPQPGIDVPGIR